MEERTQAIKKSLEEAQAARAEAAARSARSTRRRSRPRYAEAQAIRATALKEAAEEQRRLVEGARAEAGRLVESRRGRRWRRTSVARARSSARKWSTSPSPWRSELIRKSLRDEDHRRIVQDAIARVDRVN